jgi:tRNA (guanine-N7-)-methyltransferase
MSETDDKALTPQRSIRSFVIRGGRMTVAQERALKELWPKYALEFSGSTLDLDQAFGRRAARRMEIGFGIGEVIAALAAAHPDDDFIGVEVHRPGVGRLLLAAESLRLCNLRVICHDAVEVLKSAVNAASLDEVLIFFPDPWHKKRHHKRRLIQPDFVALVASRLKPQGVLRLATDWHEYAEQILQVCSESPLLENLDPRGYTNRPEFRPATRFERRGERLGHGVWDLAFRRKLTE